MNHRLAFETYPENNDVYLTHVQFSVVDEKIAGFRVVVYYDEPYNQLISNFQILKKTITCNYNSCPVKRLTVSMLNEFHNKLRNLNSATLADNEGNSITLTPVRNNDESITVKHESVYRGEFSDDPVYVTLTHQQFDLWVESFTEFNQYPYDLAFVRDFVYDNMYLAFGATVPPLDLEQ